jgi:tetratricopeptide (TPR) repeat protein
MKKLLFLFLIVIASIARQSYAQNRQIDSLLSLIKSDAADTNKVKHLYGACNEYRVIGEYGKGLSYGKQALALAQNLSFKKGIVNSYNNIGNIYYVQGNYPEALANHFASLKIKEEINDKQGIGVSYNNIGIIYSAQGNYAEALKYYNQVLRIQTETKDKYGVASAYNNIGVVYEHKGNNAEALKNYFLSLKVKEEIGDTYGVASEYNNIGNIYSNQGKYAESLKNYLASLKIKEDINDKDGIATSFINIGTLYIKLNKKKEDELYLNKALQLSKEIGSKDNIKESYSSLIILDSITNNYKAAFEHHKLFIVYRDSLNNEETKQKSLQSAMQYEFDKKEIATKAEQDKLDAINAEEKKKQQIVIYAVAGLLLLVGVFAVFMYNRFRITQKQKAVIEEQKVLVDKAYESLHEKNKEVMDSIHYAKRIQTALITSEKSIANSLKRLMQNN